MNNFKSWLNAARPFSLTGSMVPVILGAVYSLKYKIFSADFFLLTLFAIVFLQSGVNMLNAYDDFINKVDTIENKNPNHVILNKSLNSKTVLLVGRLLLILGSAIGIFLSIKTGWPVLVLALIGVFIGYSYTGKPLELKYKGLGIPFVFIIFGPLITLGSYYVQAQKFSLNIFLLSLPIGLLTTAILHANDIRDIDTDRKAGIKTLSIIIGREPANIFYYSLIFISYTLIIVYCFLGILPLVSLICIMSFPTALKNMKKLHLNKNSTGDILTLDKETGMLHTQFSILLILSILIPLFFK